MTEKTKSTVLAENIAGAAAVFESLASLNDALEQAVALTATCLAGGHKVLTCGNGGSAAEAAHLAGELVGRYKTNRRPYPCLSLPDVGGVVTCIANDFDYDQVFSRQVEAFAQPGDLVIVFSSSGNSVNIAAALDAAKQAGAESVAFLGKSGGMCKGKATAELVVASDDTARIQEAHQLLLHSFCDLLEAALGHE